MSVSPTPNSGNTSRTPSASCFAPKPLGISRVSLYELLTYPMGCGVNKVTCPPCSPTFTRRPTGRHHSVARPHYPGTLRRPVFSDGDGVARCSLREAGIATEWFPLQVGQRSPQPFQRPKQEVTQPDWRHYQLNRPNYEDDGELLHSRHFANQAKAVTVEKSGAHHRMHNVVRKRHPADCSQASR